MAFRRCWLASRAMRIACAFASAAWSKRRIAACSSALSSPDNVANMPLSLRIERARSSKARARRVFSSNSSFAWRTLSVRRRLLSRSISSTMRAAISIRPPAAAVAERVTAGGSTGVAVGFCLGSMLLRLLLAQHLAHNLFGDADAAGLGHDLGVFLGQHVAERFLAGAAAEHALGVDAGEHVLHHLRQEQRLEVLRRLARGLDLVLGRLGAGALAGLRIGRGGRRRERNLVHQ